MNEEKEISEKQEDRIRALLDRLRVAWERRPEMRFVELVMEDMEWSTDFVTMTTTVDGRTDEEFITAIEKLCEGEK